MGRSGWMDTGSVKREVGNAACGMSGWPEGTDGRARRGRGGAAPLELGRFAGGGFLYPCRAAGAEGRGVILGEAR